MTEVRRDKLGRKIPVYDRAAVEARKKEKYGEDFHRRIGTMGGKQRTRGYFGYLKDTNPEEFKKFEAEQHKKAAKVNKKRVSTPISGQ